MSYSDSEIDGFIAACEDHLDALSAWEQSFIESLREQWDRRRSLSERQVEILDRIYSEKTP